MCMVVPVVLYSLRVPLLKCVPCLHGDPDAICVLSVFALAGKADQYERLENENLLE